MYKIFLYLCSPKINYNDVVHFLRDLTPHDLDYQFFFSSLSTCDESCYMQLGCSFIAIFVQNYLYHITHWMFAILRSSHKSANLLAHSPNTSISQLTLNSIRSSLAIVLKSFLTQSINTFFGQTLVLLNIYHLKHIFHDEFSINHQMLKHIQEFHIK